MDDKKPFEPEILKDVQEPELTEAMEEELSNNMGADGPAREQS